jgi:ATP-dependent transcriptional regulator
MQLSDRKIYPRKALNQSLEAIWHYPLTVVEAPMGYGKTTAMREFLKGSEAEVLWCTVFDSSPSVFWQGFNRLLAKFDPVCADRLGKLGIPGDNVLREEAVELIGDIEFPSRTVIVIDDYHLLASQDIDRLIERLIQAAIQGLHIVILSRNVFGENTAELALKGYCLVLGRKYFELTAAETDEYCRLCGVRLNADEAACLQAYSEGWISAVYLCILGYRQTGRFEQQAANLHEIIEKVVYRPCSPEMKEFLLTICIFDRFTREQAEHIWRKGNAESLLTQLITENAFITFDYDSQAYTMHNILSGYLRQIFDREPLAKRQGLLQLAGKWHFDAGDYGRAMDYFYQAGDFECLLTAIETSGSFFARQPKEARRNYFRECPPEIKLRHPVAGLRYAYDFFAANEPKLFARQCLEAADSIQNSPALDERGRRHMQGELEILRGVAAFNDLAAMAGHFKEAGKLFQGPSDFIDAKSSWTFGSPSALYLYYRESGNLAAAVETAGAGIAAYYQLTDSHGAGAEYVMAAERYYNIGDFDNAAISAHTARHVAEAKRQPSVVICAAFLQMRLALVKGDWSNVRNQLQRLRETVKKLTGYSNLFYTLDLCEGYVFACLNQEKRIPAWIAAGQIPDILPFPCHAFCHMLRAKALLAGGQYHELAGIAGQLLKTAGFFPNLLAEVYIRISEAAALDKLWRREEALAALAKALAIAAPDGVVMPFAENGEWIAELLLELQRAGQYRDFIGKVLEISRPVIPNLQAIAAKLESDDGKTSLTGRETEIAELVAAGLSNRAIAKTLNLAAVTIGKTLTNIFIKLGVSNRTALTNLLGEQRKK